MIIPVGGYWSLVIIDIIIFFLRYRSAIYGFIIHYNIVYLCGTQTKRILSSYTRHDRLNNKNHINMLVTSRL